MTDDDHWDGTHPEDVMALEDETDAEWQVLVEETATGNRHWRLTTIRPAESEADAHELAFELARGFQPEHPMSPQGRRIFQVGADQWVVEVPGATTDFHFRVSVARLVTSLDKKGKVVFES